MALTKIPGFALDNNSNVTFSNANITGNLTSGNIKTDNLLYANGSPWALGGTYANSNVANYLPTYSGNFAASDVSLSGNIIPTSNNTVSLGDPTHVFRDVYIGPGSLYIDGSKVLESSGQDIIIAGDVNQNLRVVTSGSGDVELDPIGTGVIAIKGPLQIEAGSAITSSDGNAIRFTNQIAIDQLTSYTANTDLTMSANGSGNIKIDDDLVITGNLTIQGTSGNLSVSSLSVQDNIIDINAETTGTPSLNAGIRVIRGDDPAVQMRWNETTNLWQITNDGANYLDLVGKDSAGNISAGNVTATYFVGDGSLLTGLSSSYSNIDVANYLPTYTGTLTPSNLTITTSNLHVLGGTTGQVLGTDGTGNLSWTTPSGGGGGGSGSPGGSNTYIQFNDGGTFGGDAGLTFDKTTDTLSIGNIITSGQVQAGSGSGGNITGASVVSSNAFLVTSQLTLPSATAGQIDYDGSVMYLADNTTSGRGVLQPIQMYRYTSTGSALGTAITDYFPSTSSLNLEANSMYDIDAHCYFLKTTAGSVTWTWAFSSGIDYARSYYVGSVATGFNTSPIVAAALTSHAVVRGGATVLAHPATGSLTTGVYHSYHIKLFLLTSAACNIRLRVTNSAGTVTPQPGSFYTVRKISATTGTFAA